LGNKGLSGIRPDVSKQESNGQESGLRHQLSAGEMAMVAVGGSIGTGLLLGSAAAMEIAGPAVILSFVLAGFLCWLVTMALGELSSTHPAAGSFGLYADLYLSPWAGFISRAGYWVAICASVGANLVASATYMRYWFPSTPALVWVGTFSLLLILVNLRSVGDYGRFEYWFAMVKLVTIATFIVVGGMLLTGGRVPAQYTAHGGFFPKGTLAPLLAMTFALYTFGGIEMVAITTGESRSLDEIPRAVKWTFLILAVVYLGSIVVLVGVMPWDRTGVHESPFVTVFRTIGIPLASGLMSFVILTAALSGANANLYSASRMLFSLARGGWAPASMGRLNAAGSPKMALIASSYGVVLAVVLELWAPKNAFVYILSGALFGLMLSWMVSLAAHVSFRRRMSKSQVAALPMRAPLGAFGSALGFTLVTAAVLRTWWDSRVSLISGASTFLILTVAYLLLKSDESGSADS
jgi:L-asparagine transporter-like permease